MLVAAGNRSTDKVTVYDMDSALQNRFPMHIEVDAPSAPELLKYFESKGKFNQAVWAFLGDFKQSRVWNFDEQTTDPAWASPRSWEFLIDLLEDTKAIEDKSQRFAMIRDVSVACIGDTVGRELYGYIKLAEEIDVKQILDKPESFLNIERPDVRHSIITEVGAMYQAEPKLEAKVVNFVYAVKQQPELVMLCLTMFAKTNKNFVKKVLADPRADQLASHMEKFLAM
jgi:hypothetical protein